MIWKIKGIRIYILSEWFKGYRIHPFKFAELKT